MKTTPKLANNKDTSRYSSFVCNLVPVGCRVDNLEGKEYLVVPMVILTEGVHKGSLGPLYYPPEELSKTPAAWNHKPIVVYHPTMNGEGISACDPVILNSRKVGLMLNTRYEAGRLKSEAWIDRGRANEVDDRIMARVEAKEMMELSTGVFLDVDPTEGVWNKEEYAGVARNFRPDHLALLPDQIGACSLADGAGLLRNQRSLSNHPTLADNEMSMSNISAALGASLRQKLNATGDTGPFPWIADVYSNFLIYEWDNKLWRLGYSATDTGVTLSDEPPVEVKRVTEYRTATGAFVGNNTTNTSMNKKRIIAILMANAVTSIAGVTLTENMTDEQLKPLTDEALEKALNEALKKPAPTTPPAPVAANAAAPAAAPEGQPATGAETPKPAPAPAPAKVVNLADYINAAPKEIQDVLRNSMTLHDEEKAKLIANILGNKNNTFTKEDLTARPLNELRALSRLAGAEAPQPVNYAGQAPVPAGNAEAEEAMEVPTLNFAAK